MIIRPATRDDLTAIVTLLADDPLGAAREDLGPPLADSYHTAFDAVHADPNQCLVVAEDNGSVVGTLQLTLTPGLSRKGALRGTIEAVRVHATCRSRGLGARLIDWATDEASRRGCVLMQLTTDASRNAAHRFYDRLGFTPSHIGYKKLL
ncbi:transcriptional regulator [Citreicella sp. 357]|nr:transcriptional regulator [Citreicella sp. 357]